MGRRVSVKTNEVSKLQEKVPEVAKKTSTLGKPVTVGETTYSSRSEAIREMLKLGKRKADIAKAIGSSYSFVQTIASRAGIDYSVIKEQTKADVEHKKMLSARNDKISAIPKMKEKLEKMLTKKIDLDAQIESLMGELTYAEDIFHLINVFPMNSVSTTTTEK